MKYCKRLALWIGLPLLAILAADFALSGAGAFPISQYIARAAVFLIDEVSTVLCTEGQACVGRGTPYGAQYVTPIDLSGNVITGGGGGSDTELPAAAALADNAANPTAPAVDARISCWDGSTWDRCPGTAADGLTVNLGANNDVNVTQVGGNAIDLGAGSTGSGTPRVVIASNQSAIPVSQGCDFPTLNFTHTWTSTPPADQVLQTVSGTDGLVICKLKVQCSADATTNTDMLLEWDDSADVTIIDQDGVPPGGGWMDPSPFVIGADAQDLLLTAEAVTGGSCTVWGQGFLL